MKLLRHLGNFRNFFIRGSTIDWNRVAKMLWISQNWVKVLQIFSNLWMQLSLSQKSRGQYDPLHPSNVAPDHLFKLGLKRRMLPSYYLLNQVTESESYFRLDARTKIQNFLALTILYVVRRESLVVKETKDCKIFRSVIYKQD